jgi:hypothetical protein
MGTIYHFRVTSKNSLNASSASGDNTFTTPSPIAITITSPVNGATINRADVMVKGTVTNTTGNETGVVINGIVATTYGNNFIVNHVPLTEGSNTITVTATDTAGNTATASISVNAITTTPYIELHANIESGIAPLTTYFSVSTSIPNAVSSYQMDYEGDAIIDYTGTTFDNISFTYNTEGIYYPTVIVTDTQGVTYSDTIAIVVLNASDLDALLKAKWNAMKIALANQDVNGALNYYTEESQELYNELFTTLNAQLPQIVQEMQDIQLIYAKDNTAKYRIRASEVHAGQTYEITYYIYFVVDENGIWKIHKF